MNIEMALRSAMLSFSQVHVLATDAKNVAQGMELLHESIKALEKARKDAENENQD